MLKRCHSLKKSHIKIAVFPSPCKCSNRIEQCDSERDNQ